MLTVESRAVYAALVAGVVGAGFGLIVTLLRPDLELAGKGSFGLMAATGAAVVSAVVAAIGYARSRDLPGEEWRRDLPRAASVVNLIAVVIAHTALAFLGVYAVFQVLSLGLIGLDVTVFFGTALMAGACGVTAYMVLRSVSRTTTQRLTSLLMSFVALGCLTAAVASPDPYWWKIHFSQLGTYGDIASWLFNGTLIAGGMLVTTFAAYLAHDLRTLVSAGRLADADAPRWISVRFVIVGVMLALVGLVPVDVSFLVHTVAASGMAVVYLILLIGGRRHLAGMPAGYFVAVTGFLVAIGASIVLFFARFFNVTAFEVAVFALIFGWITVFIRFLGAAGDGDVGSARPDAGSPVLVALTGLPGSGKTTVARELAAELGAVHVRVDVIETALETSGAVSLEENPALGYRVAYFEAREHLRNGVSVVADTVNPIAITRDAWRGVATESGARLVEVEVVCSDATEHRRRVEARRADIPGHVEPTWDEVVAREFEPLELGPTALRVDTATSAHGDVAAVLGAASG